MRMLRLIRIISQEQSRMKNTEDKPESKVSRILSEDVISIGEARAELEEVMGYRPDKSVLIRWINRGVGGTKLEAIRLGNQWFLSRQSLNRFIVARS
jgi:hypothetical protein